MKRTGFILILSLFMGSMVYSQDLDEGTLNVIQDSRIDTLLAKYVEINEIHPSIQGWRIEIFFESGNYSKKQAMEAKSNFVNQYPEVPSYITFQKPYYKVRVGDFRTKMDAEKFLGEIAMDYPQAFLVNDEINFPQLDL